jgi:hypothetical protein
MIVTRLKAVLAGCAILAATGALSPEYSASIDALPVGGLLWHSSFTTPGGETVTVETAVFRRDRVTVRISDYPEGGTTGETVLRSLQPRTVAAINGGYFTEDYRPDGLLELAGVVQQPLRSGLSGVVGSAVDDAPVVLPAAGIDTAKLRDALQSGPFLVDPGGANGIRRDDGQRARRSLVILGKNRIGVGVTTRCGLYDLASALVRSPWSFGVDRVERALNLDGGPSTGFAVRLLSGRIESVPESVRLRTVLTIVERSPTPAPSAQPKAP